MKNNNTNTSSKSIYPQGKLICPVCGEEFEANDDTRYIIAGGYTCVWKCFLDEVKKRESQKKEEVKIKNNKK